MSALQLGHGLWSMIEYCIYKDFGFLHRYGAGRGALSRVERVGGGQGLVEIGGLLTSKHPPIKLHCVAE